ncbi:MAG: hypothetical protein M3O02_04045 [Acidobacteriota bacterium]|nr:hypothetical protein [Acidobacteriota bacterium]
MRAPHHVRRAAAALLVLAAPLCSQTHKVTKPESVTRAVGVYEWTGDMAKPNAMRLIPVSLFIDGKFEDAAVYLARPVPFALATGNVYEVQQSGLPKGFLDLSFARHLVPVSTASTSPYDDGWFGYGKFVSPASPRKSTLKPSKTLAVIDAGDDSRPHFSAKSATPGSGGSATNVPAQPSADSPAGDPDRPTLHRSETSAKPDAGNTPPADPDRPTLHRDTAAGRTPEDSSIDDPDRPTLRRRSADAAAKAAADRNAVTDVPSLNADPNRPTLHRGKPASAAAADDLHQLAGLPPEQDLHQMAAVSDPVDRTVHEFTRAFDDEAEHQAILAKMEAAAQAQLAAYDASATPQPAPALGKPDTRHPNSKLRRGAPAEARPATQPALKLVDEKLNAFMLSYGAPASFVFTARTRGDGAPIRYITVVSELDMQGNPQIVLKSVTDAAHLDRTPRMRLVDAVDPDASNRASLLFELRSQNSRQFALYRIFGGRADQIFLSGSTR